MAPRNNLFSTYAPDETYVDSVNYKSFHTQSSEALPGDVNATQTEANVSDEQPPPSNLETEVLGDNQIYQIIYSNLLYFAVMYIIPLACLAYLNFKLIVSLNAIKQKALNSGRRRKEDNITHCVVAIVCVFFVTQTPALLNQIFWATFEATDRDCGRFHYYYTKLSDVLVVFNSSCNFVVYCLFGKTFRQIFYDTMRCRRSEAAGAHRGGGGRRSNRSRYSQVDNAAGGRTRNTTGGQGATVVDTSGDTGGRTNNHLLCIMEHINGESITV